METDSSQTIRVLVIEDNSGDARLIKEMLKESKRAVFIIEWFKNLKEAVDYLSRNKMDVVLADLSLPDSTGLQTVYTLSEHTIGLPIIVLTGLDDEQVGVNAVQAGAQDYLVKGTVDSALLTRVIHYAIERKKSEEQIVLLAYYDHLTKLPNRFLLEDRLDQTVAAAKRYNRMGAVLFLDLDNFKTINDSLGHRFGDLMLKEVSQRLLNCIRKSELIGRNNMRKPIDTVARLGGDEFIVMLTEIKHPEDAVKVALRIFHEFEKPCKLEDNEVQISTSIGIALFPGDGQDTETILKHADIAMYDAKSKGKKRFQYFKDSLNDFAASRLTMETDLRKAISNNEFVLFYQPIMDVKSGKIVRMEALLRWRRVGKNMVPPVEFIPVAEENQMIIPIGNWVLQEVCSQIELWQQSGLKPIPVSINLSPVQLRDSHLYEYVKEMIKTHNISGDLLEFEVKENILMMNSEDAIQKLNSFKSLGIRITIDNFGKGFSSFSCLKQIPLDYLKLDNSFIKDISTNKIDSDVISAMVAMGHSLNLHLTAEGVETQEQYQCLKKIGCDAIQGYLLMQPVPSSDMTKMLAQEMNGIMISEKMIEQGKVKEKK